MRLAETKYCLFSTVVRRFGALRVTPPQVLKTGSLSVDECYPKLAGPHKKPVGVCDGLPAASGRFTSNARRFERPFDALYRSSYRAKCYALRTSGRKKTVRVRSANTKTFKTYDILPLQGNSDGICRPSRAFRQFPTVFQPMTKLSKARKS